MPEKCFAIHHKLLAMLKHVEDQRVLTVSLVRWRQKSVERSTCMDGRNYYHNLVRHLYKKTRQ